MTASSSSVIPAGGTFVQSFAAIPICPNGTQFLITAVNAAPDFFSNQSVAQLGLWGVRVNVVQTNSGGATSKPILLYGNGPQHLSVTLPAGQPPFNAGSAEVIVKSISGPVPVDFAFILHLSGYCGVPFATP